MVSSNSRSSLTYGHTCFHECPSPACPNCNITDIPAAMAKLNECFAKCIRTSSLSRALFYIELIKLSENRNLQHALFDMYNFKNLVFRRTILVIIVRRIQDLRSR